MNRLVTVGFVLIAAMGCSNPTAGGTTEAGSPDVSFGDVSLADGASATLDDAAGGADVPLIDAGEECTDKQRGCLGAVATKICIGGKWMVEEQCQSPKFCKEGQCALPAECKPGEVGECAGYDTASVCAKDGKAWLPVYCPTGELCVQGKCKLTDCVPGISLCEGEQHYKTCLPDGSGWGEKTDCKTGAYCLGGKCVSLCEQNLKVSSHVGCEYWSADLDNYDDPSIMSQNPKFVPHSVVISNPGIYDAEITFELKPPYKADIKNNVVKAGQSVEFKMPVMNVDDNSISQKAIRVTSTQPVVAYQFNPFNADQAYSNDGSLLLPHNALGKEYYVISRPSGPEFNIPGLPSFPPQKGYLTVFATRPGKTEVIVTIGAKGKVKMAPQVKTPLKAGQKATFTLQQFDVLNLEAHSTLEGLAVADMTGTHILADKPVAVFGGHEELVLGYDKGPEDGCCAEHVEEQLLPLQAWGTKAICPKTKPRGSEPDIWVVMSGKAGVTLKTTPSIKGLDGQALAKAGDWIEVETTESFVLEATGKIQVGQFIVSGQQTDDWIGDPTFMIHPPANQLRKDYFILTPTGYTKNHASVVRPKGLAVKLDGQGIANSKFAAVGNGDWELAYVDLKPGMHTFDAEQAFGLSVYGYGNVTAYGYPGGMNLK